MAATAGPPRRPGRLRFLDARRGRREEVHVAIQSRRVIDQLEVAAVLRGKLMGFAQVHVCFVAELPRSAAGKVQRLALRRMILGGAA